MKSLKIFTICGNCPADNLKAQKIGVANAVSLLFAVLCFLPPSQIWSYDFSIGTRKGTNMFNGPANLRKFHRRRRDESYWKVPFFFVPKHYVME